MAKKPNPPKDSPPRRRRPTIPNLPYGGRMAEPPAGTRRPYGGRMTDRKPFSKITKPFKGPFNREPSKIIKPYKGPRIKRDDDLRQMGPRKKPNYTIPRGNPNAKYSIVPAKKPKRIGKAAIPKSSEPKPPSNTKYPPASSHKMLGPRPKRGSKAALLPYQGPKRNSKAK